MQDGSRRLWLHRGRAAAAALVLALAGVLGAAVAQQPAPDPADLFGSLPEAPGDAGPVPVLDPSNPDHQRLQQAQEAFSALPLDARGKPDWVRALREGAIRPRTEAPPGGAALQSLDLDIVMRSTAQMPYVRFPHAPHSAWLACSNCHDGIFVPKAGANPTDMTRILRGESCGVCHTTVAFDAMYSCERCHSVPQPGQKPWW